MSKKFIFFLFLILIGVAYFFSLDKILFNKLTSINNSFKRYLVESSISVQNSMQKHFEQAKTVDRLRSITDILYQQNILYKKDAAEYKRIMNTISSLDIEEDNVKLVRVLSYVNFNDFTKVWLDNKPKVDEINGLIADGYFSAGIAIEKDGKSIALLNGNEKCNYAVYIGKDKVPGIVHSDKANQDNIIIKYIPKWLNIQVGDEVITSGMDNIFFEGLRVGKVLDVIKLSQTQEAIVKPYATVLNKRYFYLYYK